MHRYPNFDLLRLFLAAEVVFAHASYMIDPTFNWAGYIMAVPAFLSISGFLVLKSYADSGSWRVFLRKRALRILPALTVSMILCACLFDWLAVYNSMLNWVTGGLYTRDGVANGPLWSLAWEELAYLCLAILWTLGAYRRPVTIWALLGVSLAVVYLGRHLDPHTQIILFLGPAFFIGNLMFLYRDTLLRINPMLPWALLLAVIFSSHIPVFGRIVGVSPLIFQTFSIVLVGIAGTRLIPFKFPDISYGIYIFHMPIILFLIRNHLAASGHEMAVRLIVPLLAISLASWYLIEKPVLKLKKSRPAIAGLTIQQTASTLSHE